MLRSAITPDQIPAAIVKLERLRSRLTDSRDGFHTALPADGDIERIVIDVNAVLADVFGGNTVEARKDFRISGMWFFNNGGNSLAIYRVNAFNRGFNRALKTIDAAILRLTDRLNDAPATKPNQILQAYRGLDLHGDIASAAGSLYEGGHYRNAVMDAVIALNNLVRLKSGETRDGVTLMEHVFSPKNPVLRFNELTDESDREEQKGYMMLLSGAVSGLRNPRAHALFDDDAERALEFIAFVSLLAKLVDGAIRNRP